MTEQARVDVTCAYCGRILDTTNRRETFWNELAGFHECRELLLCTARLAEQLPDPDDPF